MGDRNTPHAPYDLLKVLRVLNRNCHFDGFDDVELFRLMSEPTALRSAALLPKAAAQLRQDIFVAAATGFQRDGYFVEFGATDGVYLSNTLLLERELGWTGLLAEPARVWHEGLASTRQARIDTRCVYSTTGQTVAFREVAADQALSTMVEYTGCDLHEPTRRTGQNYDVETVSLVDLLDEHGAPDIIDYLSLDTEGSELAILKAFDFSRYEFGVITCEHNNTPIRNDVLDLLVKHGYRRVLNGVSLFDDWYVHSSRIASLSESLPDWASVSHEEHSSDGVALSDKDRTLAQLQDTVLNLIVDRDAHKNALEKSMDVNEVLSKTIADLIVDRDAYKKLVERKGQK